MIRGRQLRQDEWDTTSRLPFVVDISSGNPPTMDIEEAVPSTTLRIRLEHLQNLFLIERLLYSKSKGYANDLVERSYQLVSLTLRFWTHQNQQGYLPYGLEWLAMQYAAQSGGILCMQLLRAIPTFHDTLSITRSQIVQKLSLLAAFLDWVEPEAPNGDLCNKVKSVVQRALDEALNPLVPSDTEKTWDINWGSCLSTDVQSVFNLDIFNFGE